jgi:hypothetical protein
MVWATAYSGDDLEFDGQGGQYEATFMQLLVQRLDATSKSLNGFAFALFEEAPLCNMQLSKKRRRAHD